jgi:hypothetical protein
MRHAGKFGFGEQNRNITAGLAQSGRHKGIAQGERGSITPLPSLLACRRRLEGPAFPRFGRGVFFARTRLGLSSSATLAA